MVDQRGWQPQTSFNTEVRLQPKPERDILFINEQYQTHDHFKGIIGESIAMKQVLAQVEQVAKTDTTVLILGDTGVGKELIANAIHHNSLRNLKPFICANCSALTESLINSEMFGYEKGAFTGANSRRIGRFEQADTGTIFLDEIGDLPITVQVNLLRVIQSREFERVGGNQTLKSDFRLIAATNRNLEKLVEYRSFRADLYYRLNVFPIIIPSLKDRKEDIPLLIDHFIKKYSHKLNKPISRIPDEELDKMMVYHWPGNVRELENVIERGIILSNSSIFITPELSSYARVKKNNRDDLSLEENERCHILWALKQTSWKVRGKDGAADMLKINYSTLNTRMKKLGIKRPEKFLRKKTVTHSEIQLPN